MCSCAGDVLRIDEDRLNLHCHLAGLRLFEVVGPDDHFVVLCSSMTVAVDTNLVGLNSSLAQPPLDLQAVASSEYPILVDKRTAAELVPGAKNATFGVQSHLPRPRMRFSLSSTNNSVMKHKKYKFFTLSFMSLS